MELERTAQEIVAEEEKAGQAAQHQQAPPPPLPRTKWTHRVPLLVLIGHAASLTPY